MADSAEVEIIKLRGSFSCEAKLKTKQPIFESYYSDDEYLELHFRVKSSGLYNFEGCKIPLKTRLNIPF